MKLQLGTRRISSKAGPCRSHCMTLCRSSSSFGRSSWPRRGGGNKGYREEKNREETNDLRISPRIQEYHRLRTLMCHYYRTYGLQLFRRRGREWLMFAGNAWVSMRLISTTPKDLENSRATPPTSLTRLAAYVCATPRHRLSGDLGVVALRRRLAAALMGCTTSHWPEKSIVTDTCQQQEYLDALARDRLQHFVYDSCFFLFSQHCEI